MRSQLALTISVFLIATAMLPAMASADNSEKDRWSVEKILDRSWANSGIGSDETVHQLRLAVIESPHKIPLSLALIHMLSLRATHDAADQFSRMALAANPGDPDLLFARAAVVPASVGLEILEPLTRVPGREVEARRDIELLRLRMSIPAPFTLGNAQLYLEWFKRLLAIGNIDRAAAVCEDGIARCDGADTSGIRDLQACRAIIFALRKQYNEAAAVQKVLGFPQYQAGNAYVGIADVLLAQGEAKRAIDSFGGKPIPQPIRPDDYRGRASCDELRRVLARAYSLAGEPDRAKKLLKPESDPADALIALRIASEAHDTATIDAVGGQFESLFGKWGREEFQSPTPMMARFGVAVSLKHDYAAAIDLLSARFPQYKSIIERYIGTSAMALKPIDVKQFLVHPMSEVIAAAYKARDAAGPDEKIEATRTLEWGLEDAGRYADAAHELATLAQAKTKNFDLSHRIDWYAVAWAIDNRRAKVETIFQQNPMIAWQANILLDPVRERDWLVPAPDDGITANERYQRLVKLGPGVLGVVEERFQPNTISGRNRSPYARLIADLGTTADVPVLLDVMGLIVHERFQDQKHPYASQDDNDSRTLAAIEAALEKLTGQKPTSTNDLERDRFWIDWWQANAATITGAP